VSVSLGGTVVLDGVDLDAPAGTITGVTGSSGSGKTTLLRVLAGLQVPDRGTVRYGGAPTAPAGSIALLAQHPRLVCNPRWTLHRIIAEPAAIRGEPDTAGALADRVGLDSALLQRYPGQVSDGQLQRACLARVLGQAASAVLCDEPTAMLDPIASSSVLTLLREVADGGAAVVVVSHDPELVAALADRRIRLSPT
jgi:peptide/nickel transport system ATP-binding protein